MPNTCPCDPCVCQPCNCACGCGPDCKCGEPAPAGARSRLPPPAGLILDPEPIPRLRTPTLPTGPKVMRSHNLAAGAFAVAITVLNPSGPLAQGAAVAAAANASADRLVLPRQGPAAAARWSWSSAENTGRGDHRLHHPLRRAEGLRRGRRPQPVDRAGADPAAHVAQGDGRPDAGAVRRGRAGRRGHRHRAGAGRAEGRGPDRLGEGAGRQGRDHRLGLRGRAGAGQRGPAERPPGHHPLERDRRAWRRHYPQTTWVRDRRYVQDGRIISTTGVTASIPMSLALVEAIGGRGRGRADRARSSASPTGAPRTAAPTSSFARATFRAPR